MTKDDKFLTQFQTDSESIGFVFMKTIRSGIRISKIT
jgi:MarR family transcriptional regulator, temperature-dependent positive regulator of motility